MDDGQAANPDQSRDQLRGWQIAGAMVLEVVEAGAPPVFLVKLGASWTRSGDLDSALAVLWEVMRAHPALPAQWAPPDDGLTQEFLESWGNLRQLQPGTWWPRPPPGCSDAAPRPVAGAAPAIEAAEEPVKGEAVTAAAPRQSTGEVL